MTLRKSTVLFLVVAAGFASPTASALLAADEVDVEKTSLSKLAGELKRRVESDQACRKEWMEYGTKHKVFGVAFDKLDPTVAEKFTALTNKMEDCDKQNRIWLKDVVHKHGWPRKSTVGTDAAKNAWLLVQHADKDREFQQDCLKKMEELPQNEVSTKDIAYLTDRILSGTGKKQKYGTQALLEDGKVVLYPIEDEEHVDERRKAIGLGPLAEYVKMMERNYGVSNTPSSTDEGEKP